MQLSPENIQLLLYVFPGVLGLLLAALTWAWNRTQQDARAMAAKVAALEREQFTLALRIETDKASKSDLEALENRFLTAMGNMLRPVAEDISLLKKHFMERRE
jgi:hypothetical protein